MPTLKQLLDAQIHIDSNINGSIANGAAGANGAYASNGTSRINRTVISLAALAIALADNAGVVAYGGKKIMDFPEGQIRVNSVVADLAVTKSSAGVNADFDGDFALGTATANNTATLTGTEADVLASTATPQAVAGATTAIGANVTPAVFDGSTTAKDLYLNFVVDDADHNVTGTACNLVVTGTVTVLWENLGG